MKTQGKLKMTSIARHVVTLRNTRAQSVHTVPQSQECHTGYTTQFEIYQYVLMLFYSDQVEIKIKPSLQP